MKKAWVFSYPLSAQRRLWSDWADAQADLSFRWAHSHIVGFVTMQLIFSGTVGGEDDDCDGTFEENNGMYFIHQWATSGENGFSLRVESDPLTTI